MVTLTIHNSYTRVEGSPDIIKIIKKWCTVEYEYYGMDWSKRPPRRRNQKGYVTYFSEDNKFPSGWTGRFYRLLTEKLGIEVTIKDNRKKPGKSNPLPIKEGFSLRDYQEAAYHKAIKTKRGIINHATGSGKTPFMGYLLAKLGCTSLYIVPDKTLLNQAIKDFENDVGIPKEYIGKIGDKVYDPKQITICTIQSAWSLIKKEDPDFKKWLKGVDVLVFDEAHHIKMDSNGNPKNTYFNISMIIDAHYRFGLTATPGEKDTLDRTTLEAATGRVIDTVSSSYLIANGWLTKPYIWMIKSVAQRVSDWQTTYDLNIVNNDYRNEVISRLAYYLSSQKMSVLISVNLVEKHAKPLGEMINGAKVLTGKSDGRVEALQEFSDKDCPILITTLVKEGVNIPSMDVIIYAAAGKSDKKTVQQTGRVLRKSEGKKVAIMFDFFDDDGNGILIKHSRKRKKVYESEEQFEFMGIIDIERDGFDFLNEVMKKVS